MESNGEERPFFQRNSGHTGLLLLFLGQQAEQLALPALAAGVGVCMLARIHLNSLRSRRSPLRNPFFSLLVQ